MTAAVGLAMLVRGSVVVGGTTACPAPVEVQALVPKGHPEQLRREPDRAELTPLTPASGGLRVRLLDSRGGLLAERQLETSSSCSALAEAAAAVIGAMELEVTAVSGVEEVPLPLPPQEEVASPLPGPARKRALHFDVGAAFLGAADSNGQLTGAGAVMGGFGLPPSGLRLEVGLFLEGPRTMAVDNGQVSYERFWASFGPGYQLKWGRFSIEPQLGLLVAWLTLHGDGVTSIATKTAPDLGGQVGLAAQWSIRGRAVWAGLFVLGWTLGTEVQIGGPGQARALPPWGGLLGLGMRLGVG